MGGPTPIDILQADPNVHHQVNGEDDYVRQQRHVSTADARTQILLEPVWRIRSAFNDALIPIETRLPQVTVETLQRVNSSGIKSKGLVPVSYYPGYYFEFLLKEATATSNMYLVFINRVRLIFESARIFWQATAKNGQAMLNVFIEDNDADAIQTMLYASKIMFVIDMTETMMTSLQMSILSAEQSLDCSLSTVRSIAKYFYEQKIPLPTDDPLCRSYLGFYWHQFQPDFDE